MMTSKPMVVFRKPGKLPGELVTSEYELEYGKNSLFIQKDAIKNFYSFAIVDDLLATGGTANCASSLLKALHKDVTGLSVVGEIEKLCGRDNLNMDIDSQIKFQELKRKNYINPIDPAEYPTIKKNENSSKSLGKELTIKLN